MLSETLYLYDGKVKNETILASISSTVHPHLHKKLVSFSSGIFSPRSRDRKTLRVQQVLLSYNRSDHTNAMEKETIDYSCLVENSGMLRLRM